MTLDAQHARQELQIEEHTKDIDRMCSTLYGNSKDGLVTEVRLIKKTVQGIEKVSWFIGLGVAGIALESLFQYLAK